MTPERWQIVTDLFDQANALPTAERADYLARSCAGDDALRGEVESLLGASAGPNAILDLSLADLLASRSTPLIDRPSTRPPPVWRAAARKLTDSRPGP